MLVLGVWRLGVSASECVCVCVRMTGCVGWLFFRGWVEEQWGRFTEGRWCGESTKPGS